MNLNYLMGGLSLAGLNVIKNSAYGVFQDYPVLITPQSNNVKLITVNITVSDPIGKDQFTLLRQTLASNGIRNAGTSGRTVFFTDKITRTTSAEELLRRVALAIGVFKNSDLRPPCTCGICGGGSPDAFVVHRAPRLCFDAIHSTCLDRIENEAAEKVEKSPGNYFTGILGAFLGAIVGAIPAFIAINFFSFVSAWLFLLLPLCSYFGYKLLKGKMNAMAPISAIFMSLIGLGILIFAWDISLNMASYGIDFSTAFTLSGYYTFVEFSPEYWSWMDSTLWQICLFYLLGVVFSLVMVLRTNKTELKSIQELHKTLIYKSDISAAESDAYQRAHQDSVPSEATETATTDSVSMPQATTVEPVTAPQNTTDTAPETPKQDGPSSFGGFK